MKVPKQIHTPKTLKGSGDFYGTGIKNKVGKIRSVYEVDGSGKPSKIKKPKGLL